MIKAEHYLKPAWVRRQLELALPLLRVGKNDSSAALLLGSKRLAEINEAGHDLAEGAPGVQTFPLMLEGERVGMLLYAPGETETAQGAFLAHALQGMLESEYARRSVARETLESYREMALLQRAVTDLNHSLEPAAVIAALFKEFDGRAADCGAVFVCDTDSGGHDLELTFGEGAEEVFAKLKDSPMFATMCARDTGDIANDLPASPQWAGVVTDFQALLWLPLVSHGEKLGLLVLVSRRAEGFSAADLKRAQTLSSVAAIALRNAQLYAAVCRKSSPSALKWGEVIAAATSATP